jgi:plastocyanin
VTAALLALALLAPAADAAPARMLLTADEWMLLSSRQQLRAGRVEVQLYNRGEDAHDVAARRFNRRGERIGQTKRIRETRPGELGEATWRLRPGTYRLWCTLPAHEALGMRASLRVRRP